MEAAFYLYTIVVMLVCVASGSVSLSAYFVSRRRSFLFAAAMLLFYFLDLALIFQYEYLGQNVEYSISQFYTIDHPQLKILLALGTLEPMWLILCDFVNERRRTWRLVPALAFIAVSEIVVLCLPVVRSFSCGAWLSASIATALPATRWRRPACAARSRCSSSRRPCACASSSKMSA